MTTFNSHSHVPGLQQVCFLMLKTIHKHRNVHNVIILILTINQMVITNEQCLCHSALWSLHCFIYDAVVMASADGKRASCWLFASGSFWHNSHIKKEKS